MTIDTQRSHIWKYFPQLFVTAAGRDIRNFVPGMPESSGLRSAGMSARLRRMAEILQDPQHLDDRLRGESAMH